MKISLFVIIIILTIAIINSLILIFKKEKYGMNNSLLGWTLLLFNFYFFVYFLLFEAGYILEAPHLLRSVSPLMYLSAPFFYFYVRNTLNGNKGLKKYDLVHFLPALIHLCDLIPFYLESYEFKYEIALKILAEPQLKNKLANGLIPMSFHYPFRASLQVGYFLFCVYMVYGAESIKLSSSKILKSRNWLNFSMLMMGIIVFSYFGYIIVDMINLHFNHDLSIVMSFFSISMLLGVLILNLYINFSPDVVFTKNNKGYKNDSIEDGKLAQQIVQRDTIEKESLKDRKTVDFPEMDLLSIKSRIEHLLETEKVYTIKGMNLSIFSDKIGVTNKLVSLVVNKYFNKGFNELINGYRIKLAIEKINSGYLDDYTIDSLSESVGFNSRTTFFNTFKKDVGFGPSEYWKRYQDGNIN